MNTTTTIMMMISMMTMMMMKETGPILHARGSSILDSHLDHSVYLLFSGGLGPDVKLNDRR